VVEVGRLPRSNWVSAPTYAVADSLQDGKRHETTNGVHALPLASKALWIADAGSYAITYLRSLHTQGSFFLVRPCGNLTVSTLGGERLDRAAVLSASPHTVVDLAVRPGSLPRLWLAARLIALPVDALTAAKRREPIMERARQRGQTPSAVTLALAGWNLLVTTVEPSMLTAEEALVLSRARWQIELLFKVWKSHGHSDEWNTKNAAHILCEVSAKLLAMLVEHWLLVAMCFDEPHRSWLLCAGLLRDHVSLLREGLFGRLSLKRVFSLLRQILAASASIPARTNRPRTSCQLLDGRYWGLT